MPDQHQDTLSAAQAAVDRQILRGQAIQVAAARQAIAHEANSFLPTWDQLTDKERTDAAVAAGWWLEAVRRADLADPVVPIRPTSPTRGAWHAIPAARPCEHCDLPIIWVPRTDGRRIPLDAEPSDNGTFVIINGTAGVLLPKQAAAARTAGQSLYMHHRWTCPHAQRWARGALS